MNIRENMFYGFGKVALAIALADGKVDHSEVKFMEESIQKVDTKNHIDLTLVRIVFNDYLNKGTSFSYQEILQHGIKEFHLGDNHLTHELAGIFSEILHGLVGADGHHSIEEDEALVEFLTYLSERERLKA